MSDPFVKDNPWTLRHVALSWEASAAGASCGGEGGWRERGPTFFQGRANETRKSLIQMVVSLTSCLLANSLVLGKQIK